MKPIDHYKDLFQLASSYEKITAVPFVGTIASISLIALKIFDQLNLEPQISFLQNFTFSELLGSIFPFVGTVILIKKLSERFFFHSKCKQDQEALDLKKAESAQKISNFLKKALDRKHHLELSLRKKQAQETLKNALSGYMLAKRAKKLRFVETPAKLQPHQISTCQSIAGFCAAGLVACQVFTYFYLTNKDKMPDLINNFMPFNYN